MAVTSKQFGKLPLALFNAEVDWLDHVIKVTLHTSGYTPDQDAHDYKDDLASEVANGGGYTTGGVTLANKTIGYTAGTNVTKLDADDAVWPTATITARTAVVQDTSPATDATRPLICYSQSDADI